MMMRIIFVLFLVISFMACTPYDDNVADNDELTIQALYADQQVHHAGDSVKVYTVLQGSPPAGLSYQYEFVTSSGTIVPNGASAKVTLSAAGQAVIKVTVSAPDGRVATRTLDLMGQNNSPYIRSWTVDKTTLSKGETINFSVDAYDKDADTMICSYTVSSNLGSVVVSNMTAQYTALTGEGYTTTITLTVRDSAGGEASSSKIFTVPKSWDTVAVVYRPVTSANGFFRAIEDKQGRFYVLYREEWNSTGGVWYGSPSRAGKYTVKRSDSSGLNWAPLGILGQFSVSRPLIACDSRSIPHLSYFAGAGLVSFTMYSNGSWQSSYPDLTVTNSGVWNSTFAIADDVPVVAALWEDYAITVSYYESGSWQTLPRLANDSPQRELQCFRMDDGSIWIKHYFGGAWLIKRWNGSSWQAVTPPATSMHLQKIAGSLWASTPSPDDKVYRWNGGSWEVVINDIHATHTLYGPVFALGEDGAYHVAYNSGATGFGISERAGVRDIYEGYLPAWSFGERYIFARGNPSKPYVIYRDVNNEMVRISVGR